MDFSSPQSQSKLDPAQRAKLMQTVKTQLAEQKAQQLLQDANDKCFKMCVTKPSTYLSSSEQKCITLCMDRYLDAWNLVGKTYLEKIQSALKNA